MTVAHGSREISNSRGIECFNVCTRAYVCVYVSLPFPQRLRAKDQLCRILCPFKKEGASASFLSFPFCLSLARPPSLCPCVCASARVWPLPPYLQYFILHGKWSRGRWYTAMRACPFNRMPYSPFPVYRRFLPCNLSVCVSPSRRTQHSSSPLPALPYVPRDSGRLPLAKTTCLSILPVALLRVIKVSPFSFPFLSSYIPLSHPPFVPLFPHVASASIHLLG